MLDVREADAAGLSYGQWRGPEADGKAESQRCKKKEKALSSASTHSGSQTRSALYAAEETIPANGIDHANLKKNPGPQMRALVHGT